MFFLVSDFLEGICLPFACVRIPSRASTEDLDWLEFARCAADFGPLPGPSTSQSQAVDRLRLALKHYVLQTLGDGGAVQ